jgi:hypothetical protein
MEWPRGVCLSPIGAHVVDDWDNGKSKKDDRERNGRHKSQMPETYSAGNAAPEERQQQGSEKCQFLAIASDRITGRTTEIPVKQLAKLDANIGYQTGDVRRPNLRLRNFGDHGVLQPHHVAEKTDCSRDEQHTVLLQIRAEQTEE